MKKVFGNGRATLILMQNPKRKVKQILKSPKRRAITWESEKILYKLQVQFLKRRDLQRMELKIQNKMKLNLVNIELIESRNRVAEVISCSHRSSDEVVARKRG